jgi:hypothetical protein
MIDLSTPDRRDIRWTIDLPVWWKTYPMGLENPGAKREFFLKSRRSNRGMPPCNNVER